MTQGLGDGTGDVASGAQDLVAAGDLAGARQLLDEVLHTADPSPAHASVELTAAAGLQARVLVALGDPHSARGWAAFAYSAATRLYGTRDPQTVAAAATLAAVLHRVGNHDRAARLYRDVIVELTAAEGPESLRVLAAHADLATVEYARGECEIARTRLTDAWELHQEVYGDAHPSGIKMLARLAGMERDCGRFAEAHQHFALAQELCRRHLAPNDPLASQVDARAREAADPYHVCSAEPPVDFDQPAVPRTNAAVPTTWPPEHPAEHGAGAGEAPWQPLCEETSTYPYPALIEDPSDPRDRWWPPDGAGPDDSAATRDGATTHLSTDGATTQHDTITQHETATGYGTDDGVGDWDQFPTPADLTGVPVRPPWYRSAESGEDTGISGVYPVRNLPERRLRDRLPVPVYPPPPRPARRALPIVVICVLVALLGTAAVIAGFGLTGESPSDTATAPSAGGSTSAPASPGPTATPSGDPASPGTPPGAVRLRDNADSVALTWTYPPGVEGPVVIAGGRPGQQLQAFQDLPAGNTTFIVYGLNRNLDYCFTIGVVYSADMVGTTKPVCTNRRAAPTP